MHVLSASRRLAARRPPALLSCRRSAFVGLDKPTDAASQEEVDHVALQLSRLLRALAIGWLGWKLYEIIGEGGNTYLIAPSLTLVRSRHADNRESGIWRVNNWHSSGAHRACNSLPSCNPLALLASNTVSRLCTWQRPRLRSCWSRAVPRRSSRRCRARSPPRAAPSSNC